MLERSSCSPSFSPFLAFVSNVQQFDSQLSQYVNASHVQTRSVQTLISLKDQHSQYPGTSSLLAAIMLILRTRLPFMPGILQA